MVARLAGEDAHGRTGKFRAVGIAHGHVEAHGGIEPVVDHPALDRPEGDPHHHIVVVAVEAEQATADGAGPVHVLEAHHQLAGQLPPAHGHMRETVRIEGRLAGRVGRGIERDEQPVAGVDHGLGAVRRHVHELWDGAGVVRVEGAAGARITQLEVPAGRRQRGELGIEPGAVGDEEEGESGPGRQDAEIDAAHAFHERPAPVVEPGHGRIEAAAVDVGEQEADIADPAVGTEDEYPETVVHRRRLGVEGDLHLARRVEHRMAPAAAHRRGRPHRPAGTEFGPQAGPRRVVVKTDDGQRPLQPAGDRQHRRLAAARRARLGFR
ncbi:hypothetical protein HRbin39_01236 [bacterium HR39]|nr:hypothetical protein HRbin39_01236 [bacterium HR39]